MTTRSRRPKLSVRRAFSTGSGSVTTVGATMVDMTPQAELGGNADPQFGSLLITGVATSTVKNAVERLIVWIGRTSTQPSIADSGVRTRDVLANPDGLPFVVRINGLKMSPGDVLKLNSVSVVEEDSSTVHRMVVSTKWAFRELR